MCSAKSDVRFTPNSDRESEIPQKAMSALPPKADMCGALANVCFGPKADIAPYSITSFARPIRVLGTFRPSALAVLRLMDTTQRASVAAILTQRGRHFFPSFWSFPTKTPHKVLVGIFTFRFELDHSSFDVGWQFAAICGDLSHDLLVQPNIHGC
jgi:hypothetical protein